MSENTSGPAPSVKCEEQAYGTRFESAAFLQNAALCLLGYAPSEDPPSLATHANLRLLKAGAGCGMFVHICCIVNELM